MALKRINKVSIFSFLIYLIVFKFLLIYARRKVLTFLKEKNFSKKLCDECDETKHGFFILYQMSGYLL